MAALFFAEATRTCEVLIGVRGLHGQLLKMQEYPLPLITQHRPLKWWEKPWDIEP